MKKRRLVFLIVGISFFLVNFCSADINGTFIGNETNTIKNTSAEFDVVANLSATQWWAEIELNTSEINFGNVVPGKDWKTYREKYRIKARGNVDIEVMPILKNSNDEIFSNLYFARTFESSKSKWTKIGFYSIRFNLTQNEGYWSTIESSGLQNVSSSNKGEQSIMLDLSEYDKPVPFTIENYRNSVVFRIIPDWSGVD